jgi:hypothetical protein
MRWWVVATVLLLQGYASGDPERRGNPLFLIADVGMFGLVGTAIKVAVDLIRNK